MDVENSSTDVNKPSTLSDPKNILLLVLLCLVVAMFIGINVFYTAGNILDKIVRIFKPLITSILGLLGYTTWSVINKSADVVGSVSRFGLDIAQGTVQDVGGLIKNTSAPYVNDFTKKALDSVLTPSHDYSYVGEFHVGEQPQQQQQQQQQQPPQKNDETKAKTKEGFDITTTIRIQKPISSNKAGWCLHEENELIRTAVAADEQHKCPSGQIFPSQMNCMKSE
jgi:hypothetical protein